MGFWGKSTPWWLALIIALVASAFAYINIASSNNWGPFFDEPPPETGLIRHGQLVLVHDVAVNLDSPAEDWGAGPTSGLAWHDGQNFEWFHPDSISSSSVPNDIEDLDPSIPPTPENCNKVKPNATKPGDLAEADLRRPGQTLCVWTTGGHLVILTVVTNTPAAGNTPPMLTVDAQVWTLSG